MSRRAAAIAATTLTVGAVGVAMLDRLATNDQSAYPAPVYLPAVMADHATSADPIAGLLARREGYGQRAGDGAEQWQRAEVASAKDLIAHAEGNEPMVVRIVGTIRLASALHVGSNKVIVGAEPGAGLTGFGLRIRQSSNVIVHALTIRDVQGDAIEIGFGSRDIWLSELDLSRAEDGLIDIVHAATAVTVSDSHFHHHVKAMLIGADDAHAGDHVIRVSLLRNHFDGVSIRTPSVRYATVESRENVREGWKGTAVDLRNGARFFSCGDRWIEDGHNRTKITVNSGATYSECQQGGGPND